jgi:predicted dehydrogenase
MSRPYEPLEVDMVEAEQMEQRLGFSLPAHRLPYEDNRTDYAIGLLGLHWVMHCMHIPAYHAARFNMAVGCEIDETQIQRTRNQGLFEGPVVRDWREFVRRDDVDVIDCTFGHNPSKIGRRREVVEACAEAGKPLMIHKPVATDVATAETMAQTAAEAGSILAVNQDCRYNPASYALRELCTPERLGRPVLIEVQNYWGGSPIPLCDDRMERYAFIGHTIHHADMIRWWVDEPCVEVYACSRALSTLAIYKFADNTVAYHMENHSQPGSEHSTTSRVQCERGVIEAGHNWNWHVPSAENRDFVDVFPARQEDGVRLPLPVHIYEPAWSKVNKWELYEGPFYEIAAPNAGMMGSMGCLMRAIETGQAPDTDISGAIESLRMCLAAVQSARTGQPADPNDLPDDLTAG